MANASDRLPAHGHPCICKRGVGWNTLTDPCLPAHGPCAAVTFRSTSFKASEQSKQGDEQAGEQDDAPVASKAGLVGWLFLASGALSLAGTFIGECASGPARGNGVSPWASLT